MTLRHRQRRYLLVAVSLATTCFVALAVYAFGVDAKPSLITSTSATGLEAAPVISEETHDAFTVALEIGEIERMQHRVQLPGIVTWTAKNAADGFRPGEELLHVDDVPIIAHFADAPLYGQIGSTSPDRLVRRLQEFLRQLGYEVPVDGDFGSSTASAVRDLNGSTWNDSSSAFQGARTIWLGEPSGSRDFFEWLIRPGDLIAEGAVVASGPVMRATVELDLPPELGELDDRTGWMLVVDEEPVQSVSGIPELTDEAVIQIASSRPDSSTGTVRATIVRDAPLVHRTVPASSILTGARETCVFHAGTATPVGVQVLETSLGRSRIRFIRESSSIASVLLRPPPGVDECE